MWSDGIHDGYSWFNSIDTWQSLNHFSTFHLYTQCASNSHIFYFTKIQMDALLRPRSLGTTASGLFVGQKLRSSWLAPGLVTYFLNKQNTRGSNA